MNLYLLEVTYAAQDRETVEPWLSQADLGCVLLSSEQYNDEILSVLASNQALVETSKKLCQHPAISSCEGKQRVIYRIATTTAPEHVLCSFPFRLGEEWYVGPGKTTYFSAQSHQLSEKQISWLATNPAIATWEDAFDLTPMPVGC